MPNEEAIIEKELPKMYEKLKRVSISKREIDFGLF
jgi:hypothetical protein